MQRTAIWSMAPSRGRICVSTSSPDMRQTRVDRKIRAARLTRHEGIDFIPDPTWQGIAPDLHEHIDDLPSVCPRPF